MAVSGEHAVSNRLNNARTFPANDATSGTGHLVLVPWRTGMDRFFSKLDLRDIKIDPERSRFSPDDDFEVENATESMSGSLPVEQAVEEIESASQAPQETWIDEEVHPNGLDRSIDLDELDATAALTEASDVLKVSSKSRPSAVAGAIAGVVRELGRAEVQAIGAGATNQAIKAVAIARDYLNETGIDAICLPAFIDITIDNEDRTAIRLVIEPR
jgi:stage V sporulation protein S